MAIPPFSSGPILPPDNSLRPAPLHSGHAAGGPAPPVLRNDSLAVLFASLSPADAAALTTLLEAGSLSLPVAGPNALVLATLPAPAAALPSTSGVSGAALPEHLATVAKIDAEGWLAKAAEALDAAPPALSSGLPPIRPELLLHAAHQFYDAGGYPNYVHSAELAQTAIAYAAWPESLPAVATPKLIGPARSASAALAVFRSPIRTAFSRTVSLVRSHAPARLRSLWSRAPLLILLLGWLLSGLAAALALLLLHSLAPESSPQSLLDEVFQIWAVGFLALICFAFFANLRKPPAA